MPGSAADNLVLRQLPRGFLGCLDQPPLRGIHTTYAVLNAQTLGAEIADNLIRSFHLA